jgi:RNA polymerase sigma-70 factor (ECF subfamily)
MANFFVRTALGQFDLDTPEQLVALLAKMARNRLHYHVRKQHAQRRDVRRTEAASPDELAFADSGASPSQIVAHRELFSAFLCRLSYEERYLADQRAAGRAWSELASELGANPDGMRMKLARAIDRVSHELGLEGSIDGSAG